MRRFRLRLKPWVWLCLGALFFVVGFIGYEQDEYHSMLLHSADPEHSTVQAVFEPVLPNHPVRLPADLPLALNLNKSGGSYTRCWRMNKAIRSVCNGTFCVWRRMSVIR